MGHPRDCRQRPAHPASFDDIELARGYFDKITLVQDELVVSGWMLLPDKDFSSIRVYWNGQLAGTAEVQPRKDVAKVFP